MPEKTTHTTTNRIQWMDYARGIAIILVVYRHAFEGLKNTATLHASVMEHSWLEYLNIFFFSFRMPLFFIVSGIFISYSFAKRGLGKFVASKVNTILYPYFVWGILQVLIQVAFSKYTNAENSISRLQYLLYNPRELAQFWYLLALFNVCVLYIVVKQFLRIPPLLHLAVGLGMFYLSAIVSQQDIQLFFISDILHYYIFIVIGDVLAGAFIHGPVQQFIKWKLAVPVLLLPFVAAQIYFLQTNLDHVARSPKYLFVEFHQPFIFLLISLTGCAFIIALSAFLQRKGIMPILNTLGKYSLEIYVMHVIAFAAARVIMIKVFHLQYVPVLLLGCIVSGVVIPVLFARLLNKWKIRNIFRWEGIGSNKENGQPGALSFKTA